MATRYKEQKSYHSVKIEYFDKRRVSKSLDKFVKDLSQKNPEIEKIIVFGSFVRDECVPGSDIDLLIVLNKSNKDFLGRIPKYMPVKFPIGIDVFPYTSEEIKKMLDEGNFFLKKAFNEGKAIFNRSK